MAVTDKQSEIKKIITDLKQQQKQKTATKTKQRTFGKLNRSQMHVEANIESFTRKMLSKKKNNEKMK